MLLRSLTGLGQLCIHDFFSFVLLTFFSVKAMYIISNSNCAAFNKSVEVAQGLTTFFYLVYLGFKGGRGKWAENRNDRKIGTCGPGCGTACLFRSKEPDRQEILLTGLSAGMLAKM
jgi:hypothetical protein